MQKNVLLTFFLCDIIFSLHDVLRRTFAERCEVSGYGILVSTRVRIHVLARNVSHGQHFKMECFNSHCSCSEKIDSFWHSWYLLNTMLKSSFILSVQNYCCQGLNGSFVYLLHKRVRGFNSSCFFFRGTCYCKVIA